MNATTSLLALTFVNLALLAYQVGGAQQAHGQGDPILRARGLELVDDAGRVRAQFKVEPANPTYKMPDGTVGYPETVIFRLITADGKPRVKLTTSVEGSGLMLLGDSDDTYTILGADKKESSLRLRNSESVQKRIGP